MNPRYYGSQRQFHFRSGTYWLSAHPEMVRAFQNETRLAAVFLSYIGGFQNSFSAGND
jgi:hypothetical protein